MATALKPASRNRSIQILCYIKRKASLTPEEFYNYWENVHGPLCAPWVEKHGMLSYRQIHVAGTILPNDYADFSPTKISTATERVPFDGIALFETPSMEKLGELFSDPYFPAFVQPDEHNLIDKEGFQGGMLASYIGNMVSIVDHAKSTVEANGQIHRKAFEEFEAEQKQKTNGS